jgi:histidyl-tRNA synthetase
MESAIFVAQKLRAAGINTRIELMGRPLKKQLEYADRMKIPFAVFVGEKELRSGKYTLREMAKRKQELLTLERIIQALGKK